MTQSYTFECPQCGGPLNTGGDAPQVQCQYCGRFVVVPEELRARPAEPADVSPLAQALEQTARAAGARERQYPSRPVSTLTSVIGAALLILLCIGFGVLTDSDTQKTIAGIIAPTSTPIPISRVLTGSLPRQVRYAGLVFAVKQAEISNRDPGATDPARQYRSDRAYAVLDLAVNSSATSKSVYLDSSVPRLELGDNKVYKPSDGWQNNYDPQTTTQTKLVFVVPIDATWKDAQLILSQPNKEPAALPFDGNVPASPYPVTLKDPGQATVDQIAYKVSNASLDLDGNGARADVGKRFLSFAIHLTNGNPAPGGIDIFSSNFRLFVDGDPLAPMDGPIELLNPASSMDVQVVFVIPANFGKLELQVGELGHATAKIAVPLKLQ